MKNKSDYALTVEDFVSQTIDQIERAVKNKNLGKSTINIQFDLGVIAVKTKSSNTNGGIGLCVASVLKLGSSGESNKQVEQTEYNRISFTVPLIP